MSQKIKVSFEEIAQKALKEGVITTFGGTGGILDFKGNTTIAVPGLLVAEVTVSTIYSYLFNNITISASKNCVGFLRPNRNNAFGIQETAGRYAISASGPTVFENILIRPKNGTFSMLIEDVLPGIKTFLTGIYVESGSKIMYSPTGAYGGTSTNANVYIATTSGITGATPPTHTTGSVSDGTITWQFAGNLMQYKDVTAVAGGVGYRVTDDFDYGANRVILFIGDSVGEGSGASAKETTLMWQIRQWYRETQGVRVRVVNLCNGGSNSSQGEAKRLDSLFDLDQVDMIVYNHGINDSNSSTLPSTYTGNIQKMITWKQKVFPNAHMLIQGITPIEDNTRNGYAEVLRSASATLIENTNDPLITYVETKNSFDRLNPSFYTVTDVPGQRVHPNDTGYSLIFTTAIQPHLLTYHPTI